MISEDLAENLSPKADIEIFVGYAPSRKGYRIYNKRTRRLMEIIHVTFDEMHQTMAPVRMRSGPEPIIMTLGQLKSGLALTNKELEMLFQPMFDEYFEQSRVNENNAPSTSASSSTSDMHHPVRHQETGSTQSLSGNVNSAEPNQVTQPPDHLRRWTKDHPLDNIIGNPSRPVSTRKQLASDALWCCFHTELSKVEPKNFKMASVVCKGLSSGGKVFDFEESFAQVARIEASEYSFANATTKNMNLSQMVVKTAFLNGDLSRQSLCQPPEGLMVQDYPLTPRGIFINQAKYALETLKKYGMDLSDPVDTPMVDRLKLERFLMGIQLTKTRFRGNGWLLIVTLQPTAPCHYQLMKMGSCEMSDSKEDVEYIAMSVCVAQSFGCIAAQRLPGLTSLNSSVL
ncbi:integrase, catalytic region, zinc finger, CCHC-type containing protein [Tanacetum coccineum]